MLFENQAQLERKLKQAFDNPPEGFTQAKQQNILRSIRQIHASKRLNRRISRWSIGTVVICSLLFVGYWDLWPHTQQIGNHLQPTQADNPPSHTTPQNPESSVKMPEVKPRADWEAIGKTYLIQAKVSKIYQQTNTLVAVEIQVEKTIPGPASSVDDPNYPFQGGSIQTIAINEAMDQAKNKFLTVGSSIRINCTQYASQQNNAFTFWGSSIQDIYLKQGNEYVNLNGETLTN